MSHEKQITAEMRECIQNCTECHKICMEMVVHCLGLGGKHASQEHIRLLLDCAQICQTSADYMLRGSPLHTRTCGICAEVCQMCAEDCERMAGSDRTMRDCVEKCRRCADSCMKMSGAAV
ncbi:MAG: four-helix bundle copper-binding protein [Bryobacteraceae bacterium]